MERVGIGVGVDLLAKPDDAVRAGTTDTVGSGETAAVTALGSVVACRPHAASLEDSAGSVMGAAVREETVFNAGELATSPGLTIDNGQAVKTGDNATGIGARERRHVLRQSAAEWRPGGTTVSSDVTTTPVSEVVLQGDGTAHICVAELSRAHRALQLHIQDVQPCVKGTITLSKDFICEVSVRSLRSYSPATVSNVLADTGGQISAVSEATLAVLLQQGAVDVADIVPLPSPRYVQGWNKGQPPKRIDRMVLLRVVPSAPEGCEQAVFEHGFLVLPHLSKAMIIGRDVLNQHGYRMASNGKPGSLAGSVLELGMMAETQRQDRITQQAESVEFITAIDADCGWTLIAAEQVVLRAEQDTHVLVRVVGHNGAPVLDADDADIAVEVSHPALHRTTLVVGAGLMTVILRSAGADVVLQPGAVLGMASVTTAVSDTAVHQPEGQAMLRAMDLSCGAGGFSHGLAGQLDMQLAVDSEAVALQVYQLNHATTKCVQANIAVASERADVIAQAVELKVQAIIGSSKASTAQHSTAESVFVRDWIDTVASVSSAQLGILSCSSGLQHLTSEVEALRVFAAQRKLQLQAIGVAPQDCGLAMHTSATCVILVRERGDAALVRQALSGLAEVAQSRSGKAGFGSVRSACVDKPVSGKWPRSHFRFPGGDLATQPVCSVGEPMPRPALAAYLQPCASYRSALTMDSLRNAGITAQQDCAQSVGKLTWGDMKSVASFSNHYNWQLQREKRQQQNLKLLAEATPPLIAHYMWQLVVDSGLLKLFGRQYATEEIMGVASVDVHVLDADSQRVELEAALGQTVAASLAEADQDSIQLKSLADYVSEDPAVNEILDEMRKSLPPHLMQLQLDLQGWSATHVLRLGVMLQHKQAVFSTDKWDIGHCDAQPFGIELRPDAKPCSARPYRYSPAMTKLVKVEIDRLLAAGIIRPSLSEWSSPVVAVLKKDGTARITVNYRKLNSMTVVPQMPLPNIEDMLNSLGGSQVFTVMDVTSGYFTSAIREEAVPLTAMVTSFGLYEWLRCPQGAAGAPGHFTRLMATVLAGLERVQPFIDDIIVNSHSVEQHLSDLEQLFSRLESHGIKLAPRKVHIGCQNVKFLGHVVGVKGIRPDPSKVTALLAMPEPKDISALRSWLGLANYYRRFVKGMAKLIAPLTVLMQKDVRFVIGPAQRAAILAVNMALAKHTLCVYPDYAAAASGERPFVLATDASKEGFGAVLSQCDTDGVEQPIAFASRATLKNERNWGITDLEAGAIVFGVKKFRHMLWGSAFTILTDHRALQYLETCRDKSARLARWFEFLSAFQCKIEYKEGPQHANADGVSRNPLPASDADVAAELEDAVLEAYALEVTAARSTGSDKREQLQVAGEFACGELAQIVSSLSEVVMEQPGAVLSATSAQTQLLAVGDTVAVAAQPVVGSVLDVPALTRDMKLGSMSAHDWQIAQTQDQQLQSIITFVRSRQLPDSAVKAAEIKHDSSGCFLQSFGTAEVLVKANWQRKTRDADAAVLVVVPKALRNDVLHCFHGTAWAGHQGLRRTLAAVRTSVWWPAWEADTAFWVQHCWPCQARKRSGKLNHWPLVLRDMPTAPFDTLGIDIFGPLPTAAEGHNHVLVVQDMYTRWVQLYPLTPEQNTAEGLALILVDDFCTQHGVPRRLLSDRGAQFMAALSTEVYKQMGIRKLYTTAFHPQCNGMVERFMQSLAQMLAMVVDATHSDWHLWLKHVAFAYNASEHAATGVSPFMLATGREPRIALHRLLGDMRGSDASERTSGLTAHITDALAGMLYRQRQAQDVVSKRYELKQAYLIKQNEKLAKALGLKASFVVGEKVWVYRAPITHAVTTTAGQRAILSRKFLNHWQGPYSVLCVGPGSIGNGASATIVGAKCLLIMRDGAPQRVSVHQCKVCRDPTGSACKPTGLPSGFASYLLAIPHANSAPPTSLDDNEATWESDRHGVEAIVNHRLAIQARGRAPTLEYRVRWEGNAMADTWEPAEYLDSCPQALHEYWQLVLSQSTRANAKTVVGSGTAVVRGHLKQAQHRRTSVLQTRVLASTGERYYALPHGTSALPECPSSEVLSSQRMLNMRVLIQWPHAEKTSDYYCAWYDGIIVKCTTVSKSAGKRRRVGGSDQLNVVQHHVSFVESGRLGKSIAMTLPAAQYDTDVAAPQWSWFVYGTASELQKLTAD